MTTDAEILSALAEKLGGKLQFVADRLGESNQRVFNWTTERGIAWQARGRVAQLAATLGVGIPDDFLTRKRVSKRARAA